MSVNAVLPPGKKMPQWDGLSEELSKDLKDFTPTSTLDGISAYEHEFGRARLIKQLIEILHIKDAQPGDAHKEFCTIPFDIVCTTNFDFLLERQYEQTQRYVHPLIDEDQLSIDAGSAGTLLLKLHGDVHHPSRLIVTEADYDGFLANYPLIATYISNQLITKTAVFVGYSLEDPDFRQIWHIVSNRLGHNRRPAYTIAVGARASDIARFDRRGVKVINLPGTKEKYGEILAETFRELREYMLENVISVSKVTEERPLRELLLPRDSTTRLCFFSLSLDLLPFYRDRIFPAVEEAGWVPVTADDVVTPGDNVTAKIDMLIDRASVMVIEFSSSWTRVEYGMALARIKESEVRLARQPLQLIIVANEQDQIPPSAEQFLVLRRPNIVTGRPEGFIADLVGTLRRIAEERGVTRRAEPQRLLDVKEYRASVISAMSLLESRLREALGKSPWPQARRPFSLRQLLDLAVESQIMEEPVAKKLDSWMTVRNEVVHSSKPVTKAQAHEIVTGVMDILTRTGLN